MPHLTASFPGWMSPAERNAMTQPDESSRPLVDQSVLDRLRAELDEDEGYCTVFVANFMEYLPHRIGKLRLALTTGDLDGAIDAVLSLKTSSQMVGAERLAGLAMDLEVAIRDESRQADATVSLPHLAAAFLKPIDQCSRQTLHRLQAQRSSGANR